MFPAPKLNESLNRGSHVFDMFDTHVLNGSMHFQQAQMFMFRTHDTFRSHDKLEFHNEYFLLTIWFGLVGCLNRGVGPFIHDMEVCLMEVCREAAHAGKLSWWA